MSRELVATEYAEALIRLGKPQQALDEWETALTEIARIFTEFPRLAAWYESPIVPTEEKKKLIRQLWSGRLPNELLHLLSLLVDKRRTMILPAICRVFPRLVHRERRELEVKLETARFLPPEEEARVKTELARRLGRPIYLTIRAKPEFIGGIAVEMSGRRWDGTVKAKLTRMAHALRSASPEKGD